MPHTTAAQLAANRRNALRSTGPRTAAGKARAAQNGRLSRGPETSEGKARSAQNGARSRGPRTTEGKARSAQKARRHGLNSLWRDAGWSEEVRALARAIAGEEADAARHELACAIAGAQIDYIRVRRVRCELFGAAFCDPENLRRLAAVDRYERRAFRRRNRAIRNLDAYEGSSSWESELNRSQIGETNRTQANLAERTEPKPTAAERTEPKPSAAKQTNPNPISTKPTQPNPMRQNEPNQSQCAAAAQPWQVARTAMRENGALAGLTGHPQPPDSIANFPRSRRIIPTPVPTKFFVICRCCAPHGRRGQRHRGRGRREHSPGQPVLAMAFCEESNQ